MASYQETRFQTGEAISQAQVNKDDLMERAAQSAWDSKEQVKDIAQDAADAVKNAMGMRDNNSTNIGHSLPQPQ